MKDTWEALKQNGSDHYKTNGGVEPVDLYLAGNMFHDFALCSIIKYAFRSRREMKLDSPMMIKNLEKIIDYAQKTIAKLKAEPKQTLFEKHKLTKKEIKVAALRSDESVKKQLEEIVKPGFMDE